MVEALTLLPVLMILWAGYRDVHARARQQRALAAQARAQAWGDALRGCRGDATPVALRGLGHDLPETDQSVVDEHMNGLLGDWTSTRRHAALKRPPLLGGQTVEMGERASLPCNPIPRASLSWVRRTYDDNRRRVP